MRQNLSTRVVKCTLLACAALLIATQVADADKIRHSIAVFSGLDKITGRIISFEVAANETVQFGSLQITDRVCYTRPPTESPQTDTFVQVDEVDANDTTKRIFSGWMFAASPGLNALDHPVYDIWLTDCKGDAQLIPSPPDTAALETPAPAEVVPQAPAPQAPAKPEQAKPKRLPVNQRAQALPQRHAPIEVAPPPGFVPPSEQRGLSRGIAPPGYNTPSDGGF